ncbi:MAG: hypothetical protein ACRC42_00685, partial [Mycoplasma sp.]
KFEVLRCFVGCYNCTQYGSVSDTSCSVCNTKENYYPLADMPSHCVHISENLDHYYLNTTTNQFEKCYVACLKCYGEGVIEKQNCKECWVDLMYFPLKDDPTNCADLAEGDVDGYYLDFYNNQMSRCYPGCLQCMQNGVSIDDTRCLICDEWNGYYPLSDNSRQCYHKDWRINRYFFDKTKFKRCNSACLTCDELADITDTKCILCNSNGLYYPLPNNPSKCHKSDTLPYPEKYYFDTELNGFQNCLPQCLTCENGIECTSCDNSNNYYWWENTIECYDELSKPINTALINNEYLYCYLTCMKCTTIGNELNSQCDECNMQLGYYPVKNEESICIDDAWRDQRYPRYYLDLISKFYENCADECLTCEGISSNCKQCNENEDY